MLRGRARIASLATAALLAAPIRTSGEGLALRAEPAVIVLSADARVEVEILAPGDAAPSLTVNVGRVERVRAAGSGRFVAEYLPPAEGHPQVAIIAAVAGDAWGWTVVPLVGRGIAIARSTPRAAIRVTIGEVSFGPVTADASGEARVPVVVPPGVRFAYHREKPLDLKVPPVPHVHLAVGRSRASADAAHDVPLRAFVVTPAGAPRAAAPLRVDVTEGRIEGFAEVAPGSWAGTWRLAPGRAGIATATAALLDEPEVTSQVPISRPAGPLARLAVQSALARIAAGAEGPVALRVLATDATGNPAQAAPQLEATLGEVSPLVAVAPGAWEARLLVPPAIGAARRLAVVARSGGVEGRAALEVVAGPPVTMEVAAEQTAIVADGAAEARVRVQLRDRFGNPAEGPPLEVVATRRARIAADADGPGAWVVRYRPSRARANDSEVLAVRAGGLHGAARLVIVAPERRVGVAARLGLAAAAGGVRAPYAALEATYRLDVLRRPLALGLELGWFVRERTDAASVGDRAVEIDGRARYLPLLGVARWRLPLRGRHALWTGAGAGVAHVSSQVSPEGGPATEEAGVVPVLHADAGWGLRYGHGEPFLEARLAWHGDPRLEALRGSLPMFLAVIGYRHDAY